MTQLLLGGMTLSEATAQNSRLNRVFDALAALGIKAEPALYADDMLEDVREQLLNCDGVLVWVDPLSEGQNRIVLDALLRVHPLDYVESIRAACPTEGLFDLGDDIIVSPGTWKALSHSIGGATVAVNDVVIAEAGRDERVADSSRHHRW